MGKAPRKNQPKPKPEIDVVIERIDDDGYATAHHQGKLLRVSGALPGEQVRVVVEHEGRYRTQARLLKIIERSPQRTQSPCPHSRKCGNCSLIGMGYQAQVELKRQRVTEACADYPVLQGVTIEPTMAAPEPLGYRTQVKLAFGRERGRLKIGIYRRGSHDIVDLTACPLHHPLINRIISVVRDEVTRQSIWAYDPARRSGLLRYLLIRVAPTSGQAMVTFVTTERDYREIPRLGKWLMRKVPEVVSVQQNLNTSEGNIILGRETIKMLGYPTLHDQVNDTRLSISPAAFFQVNHQQAAAIYRLVRKWSGTEPDETVLDLYCGIGGISLELARDARRVIGIEVVEDAVRNARENARLNRLNNCEFIAGDVKDILEDLRMQVTPGSVAVLNPPRKGCEAEVLEALVALEPRAILYVSCNPDSLTRDLDILNRHGWQTDSLQPVDMFPQTIHVETVAKLSPAP